MDIFVVLAFTACFQLSPAQCREEERPVLNNEMMTCLREAQPYLAYWTSKNPGYVITTWACSKRRKVET